MGLNMKNVPPNSVSIRGCNAESFTFNHLQPSKSNLF